MFQLFLEYTYSELSHTSRDNVSIIKIFKMFRIWPYPFTIGVLRPRKPKVLPYLHQAALLERKPIENLEPF